MFGWINQILVGSTIEYGYCTDNQNFGWLNKILWLIQPNTMVNLKSVFAQANNNFVIAVIIIIIFIMNIVIQNSNNNILFKKRKKKISGLSQRDIVPDWAWTCDLRVSYLPT